MRKMINDIVEGRVNVYSRSDMKEKEGWSAFTETYSNWKKEDVEMFEREFERLIRGEYEFRVVRVSSKSFELWAPK